MPIWFCAMHEVAFGIDCTYGKDVKVSLIVVLVSLWLCASNTVSFVLVTESHRSNQLWTLCALCDLCCPISMFQVLKDVFQMANAGFLCI